MFTLFTKIIDHILNPQDALNLTKPLRKAQSVAEWTTIVIIALGGLYGNKYYPNFPKAIEFIFMVFGILLFLLLWKIRIKQDTIDLFRMAVLFMFVSLVGAQLLFGYASHSPNNPNPQNNIEFLGYYFYGPYIGVTILFPFLRLISILEQRTFPAKAAFIFSNASIAASLFIPNSLITALGFTGSLLISRQNYNVEVKKK